MSNVPLRKIPGLKSVEAFREHVAALGIDLECDDTIATGPDSPLQQPLTVGDRTIGNRFAVHPMEGWDGATDGGVTEPVRRRWQRFGLSGAKLIWGGEAMAVREDGRANPNQLIAAVEHQDELASLRQVLVDAHAERYGDTDDLVVGFQLTHSGRFCRPYDKKRLAPRIAYRHPILDAKFGIDSDDAVLGDDEVKKLIDAYVAAADVASRAGADFVDIKHCHGYLLHEFLGAHTRPGPYGGSFENRTRIIREIVGRVRDSIPGLAIGVRLSMFDFVPFRPDPDRGQPGKLGPGIPEDFSGCLPYRYGFSVDPERPTEYDLGETVEFLKLLASLDIELVNLSAGSPYYNPHIQRPALYPPSDGYQPPNDPLVDVARQIGAVKALKAQFPGLALVGTGYSYLQEFLPHVAQRYVREGHVDSVGIGRMVLSYPEILADAVAGKTIDRKRICRTFSDCTTAPRNGMPSGCFPLDDYYKNSAMHAELKELKKRL